MFITIQFPLFDNRFLVNDPTRNTQPNWLDPPKEAYIKYFGQIINRDEDYYGPFDDEKKYIRARNIFNLCGVKDGHFYTTLYNTDAQSRIVFRRFQSDGKCMAKFEIGFNDSFEERFRNKNVSSNELKDQLLAHIRKYIICPVEIKVGNRLQKFQPLINAGNKLRAAYYWATTLGKRSFEKKELAQKVEDLDPLMLIHVDRGAININDFADDKLDMPDLEKLGISVYSLMVPYYIEEQKYQVKTWMIATFKTPSTIPILPGDFKYFNEAVRNLRINLLRINVETLFQRKLTSKIINIEEGLPAADLGLKNAVFQYLHKIFFNLSKLKKNKQPQQQLIDAAFKLDEVFKGFDNIDQRITGLDYFLQWMAALPVTPNNNDVIAYAEKTKSILLKKQGQKSVFISYNHNDRTTALLIRTSLEKEGINVILDSDDMLAGTSIRQFITDSVKNSDNTFLIASEHSLLSGWVSLEVINTADFAKFSGGRKLIAGYLDESFLDRDFVDNSIDKIDVELEGINQRIIKRQAKNAATVDLDDEKKLFMAVRDNLPSIVAILRGQLGIDVRADNFEEGFRKLMLAL